MSKTIERRGAETVPFTKMYPQVRGGVCEFCGVIDSNRPSVEQYRLCPHFKEMGELQCSYCPASKDPTEVVRSHTLIIHDHPYNPNQVVVVCDDYECSRKHLERFKVSQ